MAAGCGVTKVKDIKVTSVDFKYFTPTSSRSMEAVLLLGINNPAMAITVSDLEGSVSYGGRPIVLVSGGEIPLEKKSEKVYEVPCSASLADGVSLLGLLPILSAGTGEGLTAEIRMHVATRKGIGTDLVFNDLTVKKLLGRQ